MGAEYKMLKDEMVRAIDTINNVRNILYVAIISVLTFAVKEQLPFLFLISYIIIIPIYGITINRMHQFYRAAAYIMVFIEEQGSEIKWETRLYSLIQQSNNQHRIRYQKANVFPFVFISGFITILFFIYLDLERINELSVMIQMTLAIVLFLGVLVISVNQKSPDKLRKEYVDKWKVVKNIENKKSRTSHPLPGSTLY